MLWLRRLVVFLAFTAWAWSAQAESILVVSSIRVSLGDIVKAPSPEIGAVDLGPAPPPGATRLIARREILSRLKTAGYDGSALSLPYSVRVRSASKRLSVPELNQLAESAISKRLPEGVTLGHVRATRSVVISPEAIVGEVKLPHFPKRVGPYQTTVILGFTHDGQLTTNAQIQVSVNISEAAASALVGRGSVVKLIVERGLTRVSTKGVATSDVDLNEIGTFKVVKTRKILRARVISRTLARVVEQ